MSPFWTGVLVGAFSGALVALLGASLFVAGSWCFDASWDDDFDPEPEGGEPVLEIVEDKPVHVRFAA